MRGIFSIHNHFRTPVAASMGRAHSWSETSSRKVYTRTIGGTLGG